MCSSRNTLGYDSCYDCPIGTVNELPMDTSEITYNFGIQEEQCSKIDCDCLPEAELLNRDECQRTGNKECVCRRQDLRYGDDPQACEGPVNDSDKLSLIRTPGYELKNTGDVGECDQGHFKNKNDSSICIPHTKCSKGYSVIFNGSTTEDRQCRLVTKTVIPLTTKREQPTPTMVPSVTSLPHLRKGELLSKQGEIQRTKNIGTNFGSPAESGMQITPEVNGISTHQPEDQMTGDGQSNSPLAIGLGFGFSLFLVLIVIMILCWRCKKKNRNKDLEQDIPMQERVNLQNSGTVPATFGETKDLAENKPFLPVCNGSQMDHSSEKDDETLKTDQDGAGQYTKLHNQSSLPSSEVSENSPYAEKEDYVLHTVDNIGPNSSEDIQIVEESPEEIGTGMLETQQSDQANVTPRDKPSSLSLRRTDLHFSNQLFLSPVLHTTDLQSISVPPHSLGSLKSDGMYSSFSSNSLDMVNRNRYASQGDSDYGTDSSRKNDTDNSVSLSSDNRYQELSVDSFQDSRQLSTDTQSSTKTGKSVAVVTPFRRNEMKTVDEEETCSKSP